MSVVSNAAALKAVDLGLALTQYMLIGLLHGRRSNELMTELAEAANQATADGREFGPEDLRPMIERRKAAVADALAD